MRGFTFSGFDSHRITSMSKYDLYRADRWHRNVYAGITLIGAAIGAAICWAACWIGR